VIDPTHIGQLDYSQTACKTSQGDFSGIVGDCYSVLSSYRCLGRDSLSHPQEPLCIASLGFWALRLGPSGLASRYDLDHKRTQRD